MKDDITTKVVTIGAKGDVAYDVAVMQNGRLCLVLPCLNKKDAAALSIALAGVIEALSVVSANAE